MNKSTLTVQSTEITSTQGCRTDPNMIEARLSQARLEKDDNLTVCDDCGGECESVIGCPDGSEICRNCFNQGRH